MKRSGVATILSISVVWAMVLASPAVAAVARSYKGTTEQDKHITFEMQHTQTGLSVLYFQVGARLDCEDGTKLRTRVSYYYGEPGLLLPDGVLAIDESYPSGAFHIHGSFGPRRGTGTVEVTYPSLVSEDEAQVCTSGEVGWTALRIPSTSALSSSTHSRPGITVREVSSDGHVAVWHHPA